MLPEVLGGKKQHKIPSLPTNMPPPRARPKKVDVVVDRGDNDGEQLKVEVQTPKTMQSVMEFGESLADEMATQLEIEEPFKLYYVDPEGDSMLVRMWYVHVHVVCACACGMCICMWYVHVVYVIRGPHVHVVCACGICNTWTPRATPCWCACACACSMCM
jgi:hypothetical protein